MVLGTPPPPAHTSLVAKARTAERVAFCGSPLNPNGLLTTFQIEPSQCQVRGSDSWPSRPAGMSIQPTAHTSPVLTAAMPATMVESTLLSCGKAIWDQADPL